jgi:alpha-ketoglutarate-dependent taurine dioxygenase
LNGRFLGDILLDVVSQAKLPDVVPVLRNVALDPDDLDRTAAATLAAWREALIVTLTPTRPLADVRATYNALLPKIGTPHYLAEDVRKGDRDQQRTGELWFEVRYDPSLGETYRHSLNAQPLHTDGSYIPTFPNATLMCCVANAAEGGETIFITAEDVTAALRAERPELLAALESTPMKHTRSGDTRTETVFRRAGDELRINWNYFCVAKDNPPATLELREQLFAFLRDSPRVRAALHEVKLRPGDAVVWKDERLIHGRHAFVAREASERFLWKCAVDVGVFG